MTDYPRDSLNLEEEDRLPWLEPAEGVDDDEGVSPLKLLGFIIVGLFLLGAIVGGVYWVQHRSDAGPAGEGTLIAAPKGDYKIAATEADAKKFAGEGDASFAASEGVERDGKIDPARVPEAPVTSGPAPVRSTKTPAAKPATTLNAKVADETKASTAKTAAPVTGKGSAMIQLGAYGSQAVANDAWKRLSKRFDYLAALGTSVETAQVGGTTFYRLRALTGSVSQANLLCGKLKVAGESCLVVN